MTDRLYYTDSYLTQFEGTVIAVREVGGRTGVVLDRTAFYPSSGGQPFDTGTLGGATVVDVLDEEDGTVVHILDGRTPDGCVTCRLDWVRRFEHMQQHTGQHLLSAAFERLLGAATVSFHLGSTAATIDLAREVTAPEVARAESLANDVVWEDRPVAVRFVDAGDAAALPLRKEPARHGRLRIVEVPEFDLSACGGTHVARTGAVGVITVGGVERFRGGTRVEFRCGVRALRAYRDLRSTVAASTRLMSVAPEDLPRAVERLQGEQRDLRRRSRDLEERLAGYEAAALAARAVDAGAARLVAAALDAADAGSLRIMAQRLAGRAGHAAILVTSAAPVSLVVARAPDVALDAAGLLQQITSRFGGRGGGSPELAQGGGLAGSPDDILAHATGLVRQRA